MKLSTSTSVDSPVQTASCTSPPRAYLPMFSGLILRHALQRTSPILKQVGRETLSVVVAYAYRSPVLAMPQFVHFPTNISTWIHSFAFITKVVSK